MLKLPETVNAYSNKTLDNDEFSRVFKAEIARLDHHLLPLQQGLAHSSTVSNDAVSGMILKSSPTPDSIEIKAIIFYTGIIAGCSCSDDPTPVDTQNEQCVVLLKIDKITAETEVILLDE